MRYWLPAAALTLWGVVAYFAPYKTTGDFLRDAALFAACTLGGLLIDAMVRSHALQKNRKP